MPCWTGLILLFTGLVIFNVFCDIFSFIKLKRLKQKIARGESVECAYEVQDAESGRVYVYGVKNKNFTWCGIPKTKFSFTLKYFYGRYARQTVINGKDCLVYYYINEQTLLMPERYVTRAGKKLGLR